MVLVCPFTKFAGINTLRPCPLAPEVRVLIVVPANPLRTVLELTSVGLSGCVQ